MKKIYMEWYSMISAALPPLDGSVVELGSGGGFMQEVIPGLIASDCFLCRSSDVVLDAQQLPFKDGTLRAIVMTDVFHHLAKPRDFFRQSIRTLRPGGVIVMIEPWVTPWSKWIYKNLHSEPFEDERPFWEFTLYGPLSSANGANPWIIFERDRDIFLREFKELQIMSIKPMMPFRYLVSGGVSLRSLMPGRAFGLWSSIERALHPWMKQMAMFAEIIVRRR